VMEALTYAFPRMMKAIKPRLRWPRAVSEAVRQRPRIAAYLASPRRVPFNTEGVFRHYPELDADVAAPRKRRAAGGKARRTRRRPRRAS